MSLVGLRWAAVLGCVLALAGACSGGRSDGGALRPLDTAIPVGPGYSPAAIAQAYGFGPLQQRGISGAGQLIALIETDKLSMQDLNTFDAGFNLSTPSVQELYAGGTPFTLDGSYEADMDVEWVHALAPGAQILVYYIKSGGDASQWKSLNTAVHAAIAAGARIMSISLGTCESGARTYTAAGAFAAALKAGVSVFVSSGDDGAHPGPVSECGRAFRVAYPAGDPSVVAVGGTTLALNFGQTILDERAWSLSGGGTFLTKYTPMLRPNWQVAPGIPHDRYRWAPDVAFVADPETGVRAVANGIWSRYGGTSVGAPAWAAIWALLRQDAQAGGHKLGVAPRVIYRIGNSSSYLSAFHDIVSGSNGKYAAGPGWDAVTGWGSPNVQGLAAAIAAGAGAAPRPHAIREARR